MMDKTDAIRKCLIVDPITTILALNKLAPDPWQSRALASKARRLLMVCSRQSGKSTVCSILALVASLEPGSLSVLVGPSQRQSSELLRMIRTLHGPLGDSHRIRSESVLKIEFVNRSRIISTPAFEQNIRGLSAPRFVCLDEAACLPTPDLYFSLTPMVAASAGRIVLLSTPRQPSGWFYDLWSKENDFFKVHISHEDCPRLSKEFLESERLSMPPDVFAREYGAEFVDEENSDSPFEPDLFRRAVDPEAKALVL